MKREQLEEYIVKNKIKEKELDKVFSSYSNINKILNVMKEQNGYITTKQIDKMKIGRDYILRMINANLIERAERGIYLSKNTVEDVYYIFQLRYTKTIFSHMTALYFHNLTEIFPSSFEITVDKNYHVEELTKKHTVFKVNKKILELGITKIKTPFGNTIKLYDVERSICDIIKNKNKLDNEQVKKSIKMYIKSSERDNLKLSNYSKILGIYDEVMEYIGMFYE